MHNTRDSLFLRVHDTFPSHHLSRFFAKLFSIPFSALRREVPVGQELRPFLTDCSFSLGISFFFGSDLARDSRGAPPSSFSFFTLIEYRGTSALFSSATGPVSLAISA